MFDINAPLNRQFTRNGKAIICVINSGLNVEYPVCAWKEDGEVLALTKDGKFFVTDSISSNDIITSPVQEPIKTRYTKTYLNRDGDLHIMEYSTLEYLRGSQIQYSAQETLQVNEVSYNPNTCITSTKELPRI